MLAVQNYVTTFQCRPSLAELIKLNKALGQMSLHKTILESSASYAVLYWLDDIYVIHMLKVLPCAVGEEAPHAADTQNKYNLKPI